MVARKNVAVRQAGGGVKVVSQTSGGGFSGGGSAAPAASSNSSPSSSSGGGLNFMLNGKAVSYTNEQLNSLNQAQRATLEAYAKNNPVAGSTPAAAAPVGKTLNATQATQFKAIYDGFADPAQKQAWLATAKATLSQQGYDANSVDSILGIKSTAKPAATAPVAGAANKPAGIQTNVTNTVNQPAQPTKTPEQIAAEKKAAEDKAAANSVQNQANKTDTFANQNTVKNNQPTSSSNIHTAPNGKQYTLKTDANGKVSFTSIDGSTKTYNTLADATRYIDTNNPVGTTPTQNPNQPAANNPYGTFDTRFNKETGELTTDNTQAQTLYDIAKDNADKGNKSVDQFVQDSLNQTKQLEDASNSISTEKKAIIDQRVDNVLSTFGNINGLLASLESKANNLFDQKAARSANARAQSLANNGLLLNEDVAQAADYSLADYRRDIEVQRADIMKQIADKRIEVEQSRGKMIDDINKDASTDQNAKLAQINYINQRYSSIYDALDVKQRDVDNQFATAVANTAAIPFQQEVQQSYTVKADQTQNAIQQAQFERAKTDAVSRENYIVDYISKIDQNLLPYAQAYVRVLKNEGRFMTNADVNGQVQDIITKAQAAKRQVEIENAKLAAGK